MLFAPVAKRLGVIQPKFIKTKTYTFLQVVEVNLKVEEPGKDNVHNNAFYAEEELLRSELLAMRDCNPLTARHWIVSNFSHISLSKLQGYAF